MRGTCMSAGQVLGVGMAQKAAWPLSDHSKPQLVEGGSSRHSRPTQARGSAAVAVMVWPLGPLHVKHSQPHCTARRATSGAWN